MRRKMHKLFWLWEFEKEEKWLAEMSAKGFQLVSVGWCTYVFEDGLPGEYTVRLELLDKWPTAPESESYIRFIESTGAEYIGSLFRWVYFRRKSEEGAFDIFSDIESRLRHLNRMLLVTGIFALLNLFNAANMFFNYFLPRGNAHDIWMSAIVGAVALLLSYGFVRLWMKRSRLKKDAMLHE